MTVNDRTSLQYSLAGVPAACEGYVRDRTRAPRELDGAVAVTRGTAIRKIGRWSMRHRLGSGIFAMLVAPVAALVLSCTAARANTVTNVDLSSYFNGSWTTSINWPSVPNGSAITDGVESGTGNAGTGLAFNDPTGQYVLAGTPESISFPAIALTGDSVVNSLFNLRFGPTNPTVTFTNSLGQSAMFNLINGATIRDYYNDDHVNTLTGIGTGVTAENWWSTQDAGADADGEPSERLDAQTFTLPSSWAGTGLNGITIFNSNGDTVLSALQVDADDPPPVPEPPSGALLVTGLIGLCMFGWRRRSV